MNLKINWFYFIVALLLYLINVSDNAKFEAISKELRKNVQMSSIAKQQLSDENNTAGFPRLSGDDFAGCIVHPMVEQPNDMINLVASFGTESDMTTIQELIQGFEILQLCIEEESFEIFDAIVQHFPDSLFAHIGRGISLGRLANKIKASSESAMRDFSHVINLKPHFYLTYRCRAEVHFMTGDYKSAFEDAEKDLHYKHDGSAYVMAGIIAYKLQKDLQATQYLKIGQKFINGHNSASYEYLGLAYYKLGMLRRAADALTTSLEFDKENINVLLNLGMVYSEIGDSINAHHFLDIVLDLDRNNTKALETKARVYYQTGAQKEALGYYKACVNIEPNNFGCVFMTAVSYASAGRFFKAVKTMTQVMLSSVCDQGYKEPLYLRDFYRYLNRKLDSPLVEYKFDDDLPESYRKIWANKILPNHFNYTEQPGIEPHTSDVDEVEFEDLNNNSKVLLCRAFEVAPYFQYRADGYTPNAKLNLAMALGALDVAQTVKKYWLRPKDTKGWKGRVYSWRDLFEVAVKWRKLVSMDQPVIWLSELPKSVTDAGFVTHMILKKGHTEIPRYSAYTLEALQLCKFMIKSLLGQKLPSQAQDQVMKAVSPTDILSVLKKYDSTNPSGGFTVGMQVPSSRAKGGLLHGVRLSITGEHEHDISLSIQSARTSSQIVQYAAELTHVFNALKENLNKKKELDNDVASQHILRLIYYFYNMLPLSRGSSGVAYSVALGLFMAVNKEITSMLPKEKQPDIESYFSGSSETFHKKMMSWMTFKPMKKSVHDYPSVSDTFYSSRTILEALNTHVKKDNCHGYRL